MLGKKVFSAAGRLLGTIQAVASSGKHTPAIKYWLQTGPTIDTGHYIPASDITMVDGRLTLKSGSRPWTPPTVQQDKRNHHPMTDPSDLQPGFVDDFIACLDRYAAEKRARK